jgi:hypothetical protein
VDVALASVWSKVLGWAEIVRGLGGTATAMEFSPLIRL